MTLIPEKNNTKRVKKLSQVKRNKITKNQKNVCLHRRSNSDHCGNRTSMNPPIVTNTNLKSIKEGRDSRSRESQWQILEKKAGNGLNRD